MSLGGQPEDGDVRGGQLNILPMAASRRRRSPSLVSSGARTAASCRPCARSRAAAALRHPPPSCAGCLLHAAKLTLALFDSCDANAGYFLNAVLVAPMCIVGSGTKSIDLYVKNTAAPTPTPIVVVSQSTNIILLWYVVLCYCQYWGLRTAVLRRPSRVATEHTGDAYRYR